LLFMGFLLYLCPNQMMFVSFNRNTACVTRGAGTGTTYERGFSRYIGPESQESASISS
jgi:hypothetical protein